MGSLFCKNILLLSMLMAFLFPVAAIAEPGMRVTEKYPDLTKGILSQAILQELPKDVLVRVENKDITREMLAQKVDSLPEEKRSGVANFLIYLLEDIVQRPILLTVVLSGSTLPEANEDIQKVFKDYINKVLEGVEMTEEDARSFYDAHPEIFKGTLFEDAKEEIMQRLFEEKQQKVWNDHLSRIGLQVPIAVNADWFAEQAEKSKDNQVDKVRGLGMPVIAVFSAAWCPTCQELKPIINSLIEKKQKDVSILIIDMDSDGMLARRFSVGAIPTIIFFDRSGKEVSRYTGFIAEEKLLEKVNLFFDDEKE